jgi:hypothetical protein
MREYAPTPLHENRLTKERCRLSPSKKGEKKGEIADHGNFI